MEFGLFPAVQRTYHPQVGFSSVNSYVASGASFVNCRNSIRILTAHIMTAILIPIRSALFALVFGFFLVVNAQLDTQFDDRMAVALGLAALNPMAGFDPLKHAGPASSYFVAPSQSGLSYEDPHGCTVEQAAYIVRHGSYVVPCLFDLSARDTDLTRFDFTSFPPDGTLSLVHSRAGKHFSRKSRARTLLRGDHSASSRPGLHRSTIRRISLCFCPLQELVRHSHSVPSCASATV